MWAWHTWLVLVLLPPRQSQFGEPLDRYEQEQLAPEQLEGGQEYGPEPEVGAERGGLEDASIELGYLHPDHLEHHLHHHDAQEDVVSVDSAEHVTLAVNLPRVDLIEYLHEDKGIEYEGKVLGGRGEDVFAIVPVDVKQLRTCKQEYQ